MDRVRKTAKGSDTFGDFLDSMSTVNIEPAEAAPPAEPEPAAAAEAPAQPSSLSLTTVLAYLREHDGQSLPELAKGLRSPILQTAEVINKLEASGVLKVEGKPGSERVTMTDAGRSLSSVS